MKHLFVPFVPYELAKLSKEKGFDEKCLGFWRSSQDITFTSYNNNCITSRNTFLTIKGKDNFVYTPEPNDADTNPNYERIKWKMKIAAPTHQQVVDWLREEHDIYIFTYPVGLDKKTIGFCWDVEQANKDYGNHTDQDYTKYKTYYEALNKAIEEALKLI